MVASLSSLSRFEYICRDPEGTFCARLNPPTPCWRLNRLNYARSHHHHHSKKQNLSNPFHPSVWIHPFIFISRKCVNVSRPFLLCEMTAGLPGIYWHARPSKLVTAPLQISLFVFPLGFLFNFIGLSKRFNDLLIYTGLSLYVPNNQLPGARFNPITFMLVVILFIIFWAVLELPWMRFSCDTMSPFSSPIFLPS